MPLLKSIKIYSGRVAQGKRPVGNNQQGRASDINPIIKWINDRSDVNTAANTASGNTPTLNTISGTITTASLTTAGDASQDITVSNTNCTSSSTVLCVIAGGSYTQGAPVISKVVPSNNSFVVTLQNVLPVGAGNVLNGTVIIKFIIL